MSRYAQSQAWLLEARKLIPLATQTYSKSYLRAPPESPSFLDHGKGGRVWDIDGNEYVDLVGGLLPLVLGYCDPDVDDAIRNQLARGISFSLSTVLEHQLAERFRRHIPCAEMVRFGKTGTDATSAAIRLARAYTGRDKVVMCGYHGWQDWSIAGVDDKQTLGVPKDVRNLTTKVPFGLMDFVPGLSQCAAVIVDTSQAMSPGFDYSDYYSALKAACRRDHALLIFDEVITGFRWHIGGAQKTYGVVPDLACFSKAMGNGMPVSALCGRGSIMSLLDRVFWSGTFYGETLSLAAAIATIDKIEREPVCDKLWFAGAHLRTLINDKIRDGGFAGLIELTGHHPCVKVNFKTPELKSTFLTSIYGAGVLMNASNPCHNICWAHDEADIGQICDAYDVALAALKVKAAA